MKYTAILSLTVLFLMAGCADDELVTIQGSLELSTGESTTGFDFEAETPLVASPADATPGCAAGSCVITLDDAGEPTSFQLTLQRGEAGEQGLGFLGLDLTITGEGASVSASVAAADGDESYSAGGGAECVISDLSSVDSSGDAWIEIDCDLASDSGETAHALAAIELTGCSIE